MKFLRNLASSLTFSLLLCGSGCGGKYFRPYVHNESAFTMVSKQSDALTLKVDPLIDRHACQTNFGVDCHKKGILPVYLMVTNENPDTTYRIISREIWFGTNGDQLSRTKSGLVDTNTTAAGSGMAIAGGVVAGLSSISGIAIMGFAMKATDDAESIKENFVIKQFQNVTLPPGKSAEGFVYFGQAGPIQMNALPSINIPVYNAQSQQTNTFSIPLTRSL